MSKVYIGVDIGYGADYSAYTVVRGLRWYDKLLRKLHLTKATWEIKVIDMWVVKETKADE